MAKYAPERVSVDGPMFRNSMNSWSSPSSGLYMISVIRRYVRNWSSMDCTVVVAEAGSEKNDSPRLCVARTRYAYSVSCRSPQSV